MTRTAVATGDGSLFVDALVARLHAEFGVDPDEVRRLAVAALGSFATARVQAFVPILVERRLRETYRTAATGSR
ncbi:three-helix bundle dimerization domain-containing protein [Blastococcus sp. SYSU D00695]